MRLSEAVSAAKRSAAWSGEQQLVEYLRTSELEARADTLITTRLKRGGVIVNRETGERRPLKPESLGDSRVRDMVPLPRVFWTTAEVHVSDNRAVVKSGSGLVIEEAQGIRVWRESVHRLWPTDAPGAKNKGGVEPRYDWVGAAIEMARILYVEPYPTDRKPKSQAEMIERLKDWFEQQGEDVPGDTRLKEHVSRFLRTHSLSTKEPSKPA